MNEGGRNEKVIWIFVCTLFIVGMLAGNAAAFKGRTEGMGNINGLVADDSDMFIHPTAILNGNERQVYTHYGYTFTDVGQWDFEGEISGGLLPGILGLFGLGLDGGYERNVDGSVGLHEAILGVALPAGAGRIGFFLNYTREVGEFDGDASIGGSLSPLGSASITFDEESIIFSFVDC